MRRTLQCPAPSGSIEERRLKFLQRQLGMILLSNR